MRGRGRGGQGGGLGVGGHYQVEPGSVAQDDSTGVMSSPVGITRIHVDAADFSEDFYFLLWT